MPRRRRRPTRNRYLYLGAAILLVVTILAAFLLTRGAGTTNSNVFPVAISAQNPVLGSKNASFTIFEFGDFQCPSCDFWYKTQEQMIVQQLVDSGKAKLVWFDFIIYDSDSRLAASAAYAAGEQGKFWEFHDLLYANQGQANSGWVTQQLMTSFANQLGLNVSEFAGSMNSGKFNGLIDSNFHAGQVAGVGGTPTFFVVSSTGHYVTISGPQPLSSFQQAITSLGG